MEKSHLLHGIEKLAIKSNDYIFFCNRNGIIEFINPRFSSMLGSDLESNSSLQFIEIIHPADKIAALQLLKEEKDYQETTIRIRNRFGIETEVVWYFSYIKDIDLYLVIGQENLTKTLNWCHAYMETTDDAVVIFTPDGKAEKVNEAFENIYGWKKSELTGDVLKCIPQPLVEEFQSIMERLKQGEKIKKLKTIRQKKDGSFIHVELSASPVFEKGKFIAAIGVTRNVTEKIETALLLDKKVSELKEHEKNFQEIARNINDIFCVFDIEKRKPVYINPSFEKILGYSVENYYLDIRLYIKLIHPDDLEMVKKFILGQTEEQTEVEYRILHKEGLYKWFRSRQVSIDDDPSWRRRAIISQDISYLKERELLLNKQDKLGAVGQLAAGIAHEVRNPLTAVKGFTQLWGQETHHKYSDIILSELERIESIMQEFLMLAKPHQETKFEDKDINKLISESIVFMGPEALLHDVELNAELENNIPFIRIEEKQIKQVIMNLVKNAIESMPSGGQVIVKTRLVPEYVSITVMDQGVGISKDRIPHLGEPFFSNKEKGTGLGLMVSFRIIENHRGKIIFNSGEGEGTKVEILLPI